MYYNNILETIGHTPMVKLNKVVKGIDATVLAKVETFNPGNSIKDRMALKMIEDAEKSGKLKPGGTIVEGTSGNTGMGLALAAVVKGYKCIFATTEKQSKEKADMMKALGAEVIVCPTNVLPEDPKSYYSVSKRLAQETPNSFYCNQYDNLSNRQAHYESTGPEIWEQTEGKITHLVCTAGTGGTITGTAMFLKEKNPNIQVWAIDAYGSLLTKYFKTGEIDMKEVHPYISEGFGEDFVPKNYDMSVIDHFEQVTDKDGALMARRLTREDGIFCGYSAGSCLQGLMQLKDRLKKEDVVVCIFHDHGSRYVAKIFNDDWMRDRGFLENPKITMRTVLDKRDKSSKLFSVDSGQTIAEVAHILTKENISQMPVTSEGQIVGSISESHLFAMLMDKPTIINKPVKEVMQEPFPIIQPGMPVDEISSKLNKTVGAVLVNENGKMHIVTKHDILQALTN